MSGHTPGPWTAWFTSSGGGEAFAIGPVGCTPCVAIVDDDEDGGLTDGVTIEANARLISAAPEMYDMLQRISAMADPDFVDEHNPRNVQAVLGEIMKMADRCIAKAEGRQ